MRSTIWGVAVIGRHPTVFGCFGSRGMDAVTAFDSWAHDGGIHY